MASVVGIDFGNATSKIGVARHRGIDIITNEVSNRQTPSLISFTPKSRALGESAKTLETSNFKNTVGSLKRLVGRTFQDPEIQNIEKQFIGAKLVDAGKEVGVEVQFLGEPHVFSATQLAAMYLGKLRDTAAVELKQAVSDVVISVPGWFTDVQRRAMLNAAEIAGLNSLRLINDLSATALGYGITKTELPEAPAPPKHVVFVDIGHSNYQVSVVAFNKGKLEVKSAAYDRHFGGREFDKVLVDHFAEEFKGKYKIDVLSNPKATFRLTTACERLKKVLSANAAAPLNVENIMNDVDASSMLSREEFEKLAEHLLKRVEEPLKEALAEAGLEPSQIDSIELVGGSTRIPAVKERLSQFFGKGLSSTLNQDEAVARGATLACAMLSPVFRVREFHISDINQYGIKVQWELPADLPEGETDETELIVFPRKNPIPSTKVLTFYRKEDFSLEAQYAEPERIPTGINPWISNATIKGVTPDANGNHAIVKVRVRLNIHGLYAVEGAHTVEEVEKEETVTPEPMQTDAETPAEAPKPEVRKVKKLVKKADLTVVGGTTGLDPQTLNEWREKEGQLHASDKLVLETEERKNALEEYVYDQRGKLDDRHAAYVKPAEKEEFQKLLNEAEEWLYTEEGEEATKSKYIERLDTLKKLGDPIVLRWREQEERPKAAAVLREATNDFLSKAQSGDEKYSHIDEKDIETVINTAANAAKWLDDNLYKQAERPKNEDPVITSDEIRKRAEEIGYTCNAILNRPKPKTPKPESTPASGEQTPKTDEEKKEEPKPEQSKEGPSEMDVD